MAIRDKTVETLPGNTIVIEVTHSILDRTLYFSLMRKYLYILLQLVFTAEQSKPNQAVPILVYSGSDNRTSCYLATSFICGPCDIWHGIAIQRFRWSMEMLIKQ
jgi:hypothetical protein